MNRPPFIVLSLSRSLSRVLSVRSPRLALLSLALALGCGGPAFVRVDPPVSDQGLSVALVDESCALDPDNDNQSSSLLDLMLAVQLNNTAPSGARFEPDRARLAWGAKSVTPDEHHDPLALDPGAHMRVRLHFLGRGPEVACNKAMSLALGDALTVAGKPIHVAPVTFQASRMPD